MRGLERRSAACESQSKGSKNGVASTGYVDGLIAAMDGNMGEKFTRFEKGHAVATAGDQQGIQFHRGECGVASAHQLLKILSNGGVMLGFQFSFVRRRGSNSRTTVGM